MIIQFQNNPMRYMLFSPFNRWGNWDLEVLKIAQNLMKVTLFQNQEA